MVGNNLNRDAIRVDARNLFSNYWLESRRRYFLSGIVTILIGLTGLGNWLSGLFKPGVLVVFMFLLGAQLVSIFLKGMLGLPFGVSDPSVTVNYPVFFLAFAVLIFVIAMIVFLPPSISKYALLCGTVLGWGLTACYFMDKSPQFQRLNGYSFH